jgi:hypothetical protein
MFKIHDVSNFHLILLRAGATTQIKEDLSKRDSLKSILLVLIQIFKLVSALRAVAAMAKRSKPNIANYICALNSNLWFQGIHWTSFQETLTIMKPIS